MPTLYSLSSGAIATALLGLLYARRHGLDWFCAAAYAVAVSFTLVAWILAARAVLR